MSSETASTGSTMPALRDSGQFRSYRAIPEPVYRTIGPVPAQAPFKVTFEIYRSERPAPQQFGITRVEHNMAERGKPLAEEHFKGDLRVLPNGHIVTETRLMAVKDWFGRSILGKNVPTVSLRIDFDSPNTLMNALRLPEKRSGGGEFVQPERRFPCEPWNVCVSDAANPEYHDHIISFSGGFFLQSVMLNNPRNMAKKG